MLPDAAGLHDLPEILLLVHAVHESEIRIVHARSRQDQVEGTLHFIEVPPHLVFSVRVDRAEVHLGIKILPPPFCGLSENAEGLHVSAAQVKIIDARLQRIADRLLHHGRTCRMDIGKSQPDDTDLLPAAGKGSVFHRSAAPLKDIVACTVYWFYRKVSIN